MKTLTVSRVENGYIINTEDGKQWVATSNYEISAIVEKALREEPADGYIIQ